MEVKGSKGSIEGGICLVKGRLGRYRGSGEVYVGIIASRGCIGGIVTYRGGGGIRRYREVYGSIEIYREGMSI